MTQKEIAQKQLDAGTILCKYGIVAIRVEFTHACAAEEFAIDYDAEFHGDIMVAVIAKGECITVAGETITHYSWLEKLFAGLLDHAIESIEIM